ncbi:hypothetical protein B7494_g1587 [Chlorociboria aeruginascens]|nr:hypothetical protein B7494_g1587 [Chlorociboria aeruginascens]
MKRFRIETEKVEQEARYFNISSCRSTTNEEFCANCIATATAKAFPFQASSVDKFVTQWIESGSELDCRSDTLFGSELESYRERHCQSDTLLGHLDRDLIPRRLTKSASNMDFVRNTEGFVVPPTLPLSHSFGADAEYHSRFGSQVDLEASLYTASVAPSDMSGVSFGSDRKKHVEDPYYRQTNLATNNIYMRVFYDESPEDIVELVHHIRKDRDSPDLSSDQIRQNKHNLKRTDRNPMAKHIVLKAKSKLKIQPINSIAFSIAMNGIEARLYISWKHNNLDYHMRRIKSFALQEPEQYVEFRKHVLNIIDWGNNKRLAQIRKSLDDLVEEAGEKPRHASAS